MAVAYAGEKTKCIAPHCCVQSVDEDFGFFRCNVAAAVISHNGPLRAYVKVYEVAPEGHIVVPQFNAHTDRFDRGPACIIFCRIVSEYGYGRNVTAGRETLRYCVDLAAETLLGHHIHKRFMGDHEWCLTAKFLNGKIGHTITDNNNIFHLQDLPFKQ